MSIFIETPTFIETGLCNRDPVLCDCGKKCLFYVDEQKGEEVNMCAVMSNEVVSLKNKRTKMVSSGKTPCGFKQIIKFKEPVKIPEPELDLDLNRICLDSDIKKKIKKLLDSDNVDRNNFIYYMNWFEKYETKGAENKKIMERCHNRLKEIDELLLGDMKHKIDFLRKFPSYSTVYEIIYIISHFIDSTVSWKLGSVEEIMGFYKDSKNFYELVKDKGFNYKNPFPKKQKKIATKVVDCDYLDKIKFTVNKSQKNKVVECDPLLKALVPPNDMKLKMSTPCNDIEFSDGDDEFSEDDSDNDEYEDMDDELDEDEDMDDELDEDMDEDMDEDEKNIDIDLEINDSDENNDSDFSE
jgi:hypothetical protein